MIKIKIKDKTYKVELAKTEEEREQGLQGVTDLPKDQGMLFVFDEPDTVGFWMKDTPLDLDIIFIGDDERVISIEHGVADTEDTHQADNVLYVLELNAGSEVEVGDLVETTEAEDEEEDGPDIDDSEFKEEEEPDVPEEEQRMMILNAKGESQMDLKGGERIFSRKNTKSLLKFAKRAYSNKSVSSYRTLGKKVFAFMDAQDDRGNDYVELP